MSIHRQAARRDSNEPEIIQALRSVGATVQAISIKGCPDLLIGYRGLNFLLEVKVAKGKLTDDETAWHNAWQGQVGIVRSVDEALKVIGAID